MKKFLLGCGAIFLAFFIGWVSGFAADRPWEIAVNGKPSALPVHVIKNMLFVSLEDLSQLPGWKVDIDLGSRKVLIQTPGETAAQAETQTHASPKPVTRTIEARNPSSGPPNNVRMTVQAALSALGDLQGSLGGNIPPDQIQKKLDDTKGIVEQAINLLWSLPRTRTIQADLQVAMEDLQSQVSLFLAQDQAQQGVLPWTHPTTQSLSLKYSASLGHCHVSKGNTDGLDVSCGKSTLNEIESDDVRDVKRDLDSYQ